VFQSGRAACLSVPEGDKVNSRGQRPRDRFKNYYDPEGVEDETRRFGPFRVRTIIPSGSVGVAHGY
jgi:hypothetical protein